MTRRVAALLLSLSIAACRRAPDTAVTLPVDAAGDPVRGIDPPVALDPDPGVQYPLVLYQLRISGTVLLRLFTDEAGTLLPDSSRIQESSGYPALDSAALAASSHWHYAPAQRNGVAVATFFTQPIHFRHPDREGGGTTP